jgi:TatD DNase family protein
MIDSHAHLDDPSFDSDRDEVIKRAQDAGIHRILNVGCDLESSRAAVELADRYDLIYAAVGVHPHETRKIRNSTYDELRQLASHKKVVAWGEIGLDYYYLNSPKEVQLHAFRDQIQLAKEVRLPVVIHMREAQEDTLKTLIEEEANRIGGVFHCFTGDRSAAKTAIQLNFMISLAGIVTFSKAHRIQKVVQQTPLEHLMIETDCPYLTPAPHRGKRNEPAYVRHVAKKIAELKPSYTYEEIVRVTSQNTLRLLKPPDLTA